MYENAVRVCSKTLARDHPLHIVTVHNFHSFIWGLGRNDTEFAKEIAKNLVFAQQTFGNEHLTTLHIAQILALIYHRSGNFSQAASIYENILRIHQKTLGTTQPTYFQILHNLAHIYDMQERMIQAENLYKQVSTTMANVLGDNHPQVQLSLNNLANCYARQGKQQEAAQVYQQCLNSSSTFMRNMFYGSDEKTKLSILEKYDLFKTNALSFYSKNLSPEYYANIFQISLLFKGLLLRSSLHVKKNIENTPHLQQIFTALTNKRNVLAKLYVQGTQNQEINTLTDEIEALERELGKDLPISDLYQEISIEEIQEQLGVEEALVDFIVFENSKNTLSCLCSIITTTEIKCILIADYAELVKLIEEYRLQVTMSKPAQEISQQLYQKMWKDILPIVADKQKIYIIADGALHLFPFTSLVDDKGMYLVEQKNLSHLSFAYHLKNRYYPEANHQIAIFAHPDYGKQAEGTTENTRFGSTIFNALPHTEEEAKILNDLITTNSKSANLYIGSSATKQNICAIKSPMILHIATHGFFLENTSSIANTRGLKLEQNYLLPKQSIPNSKITITTPKNSWEVQKTFENPLLYCGLAFANANNDKANGILTALEVLSLDLSGTNLVVLSACETGVGKVQDGEGVYSLRRSFQEAGAKSVLSSLWVLDDLATKVFMQKFYEYFLYGAPPQEALRATQLYFIEHPKYSHPYYWAPFVITGADKHFPQHKKTITNIALKPQNKTLQYLVALTLFCFFLLAITIFIYIDKKKTIQRKQNRQNRIQNRRK